MISCKINGVDLNTKYNLILASKEIAPPAPQLKLVEVDGRNGSIDMTEAVTGDVRYKNRAITIKLMYIGDENTDTAELFYSAFHGKRLPIIFGDDVSHYYIGRINCKKLKLLKHGERFEISVDADPFKYDTQSSTVDWEWDTFDFETGLINELGELVVNGELDVTLVCRQNAEIPTFICSSAMELVFDGVTHQLQAGDNKLYRVIFTQGYNEMTIRGNGTLSIDYIGGLL